MNINDTNRLDTDIRQQLGVNQNKPQQTTAGEQGRPNDFGNVDKLFLNNLRPQQATDFLAQHINRRLGERFNVVPNQHPSLFGQVQGPASAINQIIQTANQALHQLSTNIGLPSAAQQVRSEVDHGYGEAMDIFGVFGSIEDETKQSLSKTREMLDNAFTNPPFNGEEPEIEQLGIESQRYSSRSDTSLSIETADGDIVTISLSHNIEQSRNQLSYDNGSHQLDLRNREKNEELAINISVEGNLSGEEKQAIGQLVQQLNQVTSQQNKGHEQAALQQASSIEFDNSLIKSFDYEHTVDETVETAAYSHEQITDPLAVEQAPVSNIIEDYSFLPFKDMRKAVQAMLEKIAEFRASLEDTLKETPTTPIKEEA